MSRVRVNEKPNAINTLSELHVFSLRFKKLPGRKLRKLCVSGTRHQVLRGIRGLWLALFFLIKYFLKILLPIENRINIGARWTRVAHLTYCDVFVRRRALYVNIWTLSASSLQQLVVCKNLDYWESNIVCHVQILIPYNLNFCTWH